MHLWATWSGRATFAPNLSVIKMSQIYPNCTTGCFHTRSEYQSRAWRSLQCLASSLYCCDDALDCEAKAILPESGNLWDLIINASLFLRRIALFISTLFASQ